MSVKELHAWADRSDPDPANWKLKPGAPAHLAEGFALYLAAIRSTDLVDGSAQARQRARPR